MRELGWQSHCHVFGQRQCKDIQKEGASLYSESEGMTGDLKYKVRGVLVNLPRLWTGALINKGKGGRVPDTSLVRDNAKRWGWVMQVTLVLTGRVPLIGKSRGEKERERGNRHLSRLWTGVLCN